MKKLTLLFVFGLIALTGCTNGPGLVTITPAPIPPGNATQTPFVVATPTERLELALTPLPSILPSASATPVAESSRPHYSIDVNLDYDARRLSVSENIRYTNTTGQPLHDLVLAVVPNLWTDTFQLGKVQIYGLLEPETSLKGQNLTIDLPDALPPAAEITIDIDYALILPEHNPNPDPNVARPEIFGYTQNQLNLVDWYPFIVPYENGWLLHDPWFYGEHLVYDLSDYEINLNFSNPANAPIVASSGEQETSETGLRLRGEGMRTFALSLSREYQVEETDLNGIIIRSYFFPYFINGGKAALETTQQAIETYSELFGPYPHKTLAIVQGDFNDGMEYDGLYFLSNAFYNLYDNTERNYLVMVAAHETCHMWWFGAVGNDQALEPWLDESLATYCERLFYEKNYPEAIDWWWSYRITFYTPEGKIDIPVYDGGGFTPYTNATYRRGALFLESLRQRMGDEAFFAFLKDYFTQMNGKRATSTEFFRVLASHNSADITDLLGEYFIQQP